MAHAVEFDDGSFHRLEDISNDSIQPQTWDVTVALRIGSNRERDVECLQNLGQSFRVRLVDDRRRWIHIARTRSANSKIVTG